MHAFDAFAFQVYIMGELIQRWYMDLPPVTRVYATAVALTALACHIDLTNPLQLYYNPQLIWHQGQVSS